MGCPSSRSPDFSESHLSFAIIRLSIATAVRKARPVAAFVLRARRALLCTGWC